MNDQTAEKIATTLQEEGIDVTADDVRHVHKYGYIEEGVIGPEHDEYLTDRIQDALDEEAS